MAGTRRGRRPMTRKRKRRADWVYRATITEDSPNVGSYVANSQFVTLGNNTLGPAVFNTRTMVLVDSVAFQETILNTSLSNGVGMPMAAKPEGRGRKVLKVEGDLRWRLVGIGATDFYDWGWRLGWFEQDTITGLASLQAEYSMFEPNIAGTVPQDIVNFANDKLSNRREKFYQVHNNATIPRVYGVERFLVPIGMRPPSSKHALMLFAEAPSTNTVNTTIRLWPMLRSLIET